MALLRCDFFSESLALSTSMTVILPQRASTQIGMTGRVRPGAHPTLFLLHGLSDDDTIWVRRTSIERYVSELGLAVVMPQVHRSFYADEVHGNRYWTFISQELPALARSFFPLSARREDTFVAGLSMGGYGAFKLALRHPDRFAAAASLSGVLDVMALTRQPEALVDFGDIFGPHVPADSDLLTLLSGADPATLPALYACCGTEDISIIDANRRFAAVARDRGVELTTHFGPGQHEWGYWDTTIQDVLAWLPLT
jgi:putative tributyrin esterase